MQIKWKQSDPHADRLIKKKTEEEGKKRKKEEGKKEKREQ